MHVYRHTINHYEYKLQPPLKLIFIVWHSLAFIYAHISSVKAFVLSELNDSDEYILYTTNSGK